MAPLAVLLLAALFYLKKNMKAVYPDFLLIGFLICQVLLNTLASLLQSKQIINHGVYHANCLITFCIFAAYFLRTLQHRKFIWVGLIIFLVFWIVNLIWIQPYYKFNSFSYALAALIIVWYSLLNFQQLIKQMPTQNILTLKNFWILTGLLTYFGSSFLIFTSYNYLSEIDPKNVGVLWKTHNVFLCVTSFIFFKAITCPQWITK